MDKNNKIKCVKKSDQVNSENYIKASHEIRNEILNLLELIKEPNSDDEYDYNYYNETINVTLD
jgi:hypothetical protein